MLIVRGKHYLNGELYDFFLADGLIQGIEKPAKERQFLGGEDHWVPD